VSKIKKVAIGIDLGATNSVAAYMNKIGKIEVVDISGDRIVPSCVWFEKEEIVHIGNKAKSKYQLGKDNSYAFFKTSMEENSSFATTFEKPKTVTATELSAEILKKLKQNAEKALEKEFGEPVEAKYAVITVPAYFFDKAKRQTIEAGKLAGFEVLRLIPEPSSATIDYIFESSINKENIKKIMIYDLGGGTFDIAILEKKNDEYNVLITDGDHKLGGKDWDNELKNFVANKFKEETGFDLLGLDVDTTFTKQLQIKMEKLKIELSAAQNAETTISYKGETRTINVTRDDFEECTKTLTQITIDKMNKTMEDLGFMKDGNIDWMQISDILLVGGSTKMKIIKDAIKDNSGKKPVSVLNPDETVAKGAAVHAYQLAITEKLFEPYVKKLTLPTVPKDIIPHSIGWIVISDDEQKYMNSIILNKSYPIPTEKQREYEFYSTKSIDYCEIYLLQGESEIPTANNPLGYYKIKNIPYGRQTLEVKFTYNSSSTLDVAVFIKGKPLEIQKKEISVYDLNWTDKKPEKKKIEEAEYEHVYVYLLIDASGSMVGEPLIEAKKAAKNFVENTSLKNVSVGIISFGTDANISCELCQNESKLYTAINKINLMGGTNMTTAFDKAYNTLVKKEGKKYVILLTDGVPNNKITTEESAKKCKKANIEIITIGTKGADLNFLQKIQTSEKVIYSEIKTLSETFGSIAKEIGKKRDSKHFLCGGSF